VLSDRSAQDAAYLHDTPSVRVPLGPPRFFKQFADFSAICATDAHPGNRPELPRIDLEVATRWQRRPTLSSRGCRDSPNGVTTRRPTAPICNNHGQTHVDPVEAGRHGEASPGGEPGAAHDHRRGLEPSGGIARGERLAHHDEHAEDEVRPSARRSRSPRGARPGATGAPSPVAVRRPTASAPDEEDGHGQGPPRLVQRAPLPGRWRLPQEFQRPTPGLCTRLGDEGSPLAFAHRSDARLKAAAIRAGPKATG